MKLYFSFFICLIFTLSVSSQIDNQKKSIVISAVETNKDSIDKSLLPKKSINNNSLIGFSVPRVSSNLELPKKEFSMFGEKFGNPGELYINQIDKNIQNIKLTPEEIEQRNGSLTDQFLGDFKSKAKFVNVVYRDHGYTDGDIIQVLVNDDIVHSRVYLTSGFKGFKPRRVRSKYSRISGCRRLRESCVFKPVESCYWRKSNYYYCKGRIRTLRNNLIN